MTCLSRDCKGAAGSLDFFPGFDIFINTFRPLSISGPHFFQLAFLYPLHNFLHFTLLSPHLFSYTLYYLWDLSSHKMIPIQSRIRGMALAKATVVAPVACTDPAQVSFSWSGSSFECSPLSNPSAPPPTPTDSLYDINPRKSSFSSEYGMGAACAFPSWPNRPSLSSADSCDSFVNNAYLSDEDLLWIPEHPIPEEPATQAPTQIDSSMTMEQQLQLYQAAAEERDRANFRAMMDAHTRAAQALRQSKTVATERVTVTVTAKRNKQRRVHYSKKRAHSSSKVPSA